MTKTHLLPCLLILCTACNAPAKEAGKALDRPDGGGALLDTSSQESAKRWYGPATVTFDLATTGSPYDASANDVRVRFHSDTGDAERFAYFDGSRWKAILLSPQPGVYHATVLRNGETVRELPGTIDVTRPLQAEFVHIAPDHRTLRWDSGSPYWPLGHNFGWQGGQGLPSIPEGLHRMAAHGMNWSRIWACMWDGKNPFWPQDRSQNKIGYLWQPALLQWDAISKEASADGIRFQWVLFHHGEWSTTTDANWGDNPWNAANGGFLVKPEGFFTDPRAKALTKNYLRYVVARYADQPGILGWELFNEVENTDAAHNDAWSEIIEWHNEMARYLRSIDPYRHPVLTSSDLRLAETVDICEPHVYPTEIQGALLGASISTSQPFYYGEVGLSKSQPTEEDERRAIRDSIWGAYIAGHSGAAQFWYWDAVQRMNLDDEFAFASQILKDAKLTPGPNVRRLKLTVEGGAPGDFRIHPAISWGAAKRSAFQVPEETSSQVAQNMSSFLQGSSHPELGQEYKFNVKASQVGELKLQLGTISRSGAHVRLFVDGQEAVSEAYPSSGGDHPATKGLSAAFPAGSHEIVVRNDGRDWVTVEAYTLTGIGKSIDAVGARNGAKLVIKVQCQTSEPGSFRIDVPDLADGLFQATLFDLGRKQSRAAQVAVKGGQLVPPAAQGAKDYLLVVAEK